MDDDQRDQRFLPCQLRDRRCQGGHALRILEQLTAEFQDHRLSYRQQTRSLVEAEHDVHVLNGLACRPLYQVVDHRNKEDAAARRIDAPADIAEIRICRVLDLRQRLARQPDEWRIR